ncbi:zinc finger, C2H2 type family protein (macronuclear) [Tetrahymena thermophila SB210]|uniref:Zinc finger, C2H2 type family protein n=1 Tax=Tetrahymena thermophila (strain SB210) TaxID=312017 RepID=I7M1D0_TETTS|nr:zinc finger, C2H2 type family protein [Tetrahymena thermophila SB210]EAR96093.2 zinc finger, C2H2 type family protein [Tetrahymena thermophila SB210]|eukprot:XP_001016338.2 zinc finger, C2H2 type family protein [Tetrahymena thermophila SB210]
MYTISDSNNIGPDSNKIYFDTNNKQVQYHNNNEQNCEYLTFQKINKQKIFNRNSENFYGQQNLQDIQSQMNFNEIFKYQTKQEVEDIKITQNINYSTEKIYSENHIQNIQNALQIIEDNSFNQDIYVQDIQNQTHSFNQKDNRNISNQQEQEQSFDQANNQQNFFIDENYLFQQNEEDFDRSNKEFQELFSNNQQQNKQCEDGFKDLFINIEQQNFKQSPQYQLIELNNYYQNQQTENQFQQNENLDQDDEDIFSSNYKQHVQCQFNSFLHINQTILCEDQQKLYQSPTYQQIEVNNQQQNQQTENKTLSERQQVNGILLNYQQQPHNYQINQIHSNQISNQNEIQGQLENHHIKPIQLQINLNYPKKNTCKKCDIAYKNLSGLYNHVRTYHESKNIQDFALEPAQKRGRPKKVLN